MKADTSWPKSLGWVHPLPDRSTNVFCSCQTRATPNRVSRLDNARCPSEMVSPGMTMFTGARAARFARARVRRGDGPARTLPVHFAAW